MSVVRKLEHLLVAGGYLQVRREADRLLLEGNLSVREQAGVYRMACRASLSLGEYYSAAKLGERAVERAKDAGDLVTLAKAHFDLGSAYVYIGDTHGAEQNLEAFLELHPQTQGAERLEGQARFNLAIIHQQRKHWQPAIEALERAGGLFQQCGQKAEHIRCALDLAWCYLMLGASYSAAPHLATVEEYLEHSLDHELSATLICRKALFYQVEEDIASSSQLCQEIFIPGRQGVTSDHMGQAAWIMGGNALTVGRIEEATLFANMALDNAARCNWPTLINLGSDLRRRIASRMAIGA